MLNKPEKLPDWPELEGFRSVFVGRAVTQEMVPAGVKKFGTWHDDGKGWNIGDFKRGLSYPVGYKDHFTVFYFKSNGKVES